MPLELLDYGFMHRALVAGLVTAIVCPTIGAFLIPRRLALVADALAHVALAGVALGLLVGVTSVTGALLTTGLGALAIERLRARGLLQGDAALAVVLSAGFAIAVVLISLAGAVNADLFALLFGSLLTVSPTDVWVIGGLGLVVLATIRIFYAQLFAVTVSEDLARTSGVGVAGVNLVLTLLTALTVVAAMRVVGVLLVGAMIVVPTLAGFAAARSFRQALGIGIGVAMLSVVLGLIAAFYLQLAAGGAIALTALLLFAVIALTSRPLGTAAGLLVAGVLLASSAPAQPECRQPGRVGPDCPDWRGAPRLDSAPPPWSPRSLDPPDDMRSPWGWSPGEALPSSGPFLRADGLLCWPHGDHVHCRRPPGPPPATPD